jgi:hypothetical protein
MGELWDHEKETRSVQLMEFQMDLAMGTKMEQLMVHKMVGLMDRMSDY